MTNTSKTRNQNVAKLLKDLQGKASELQEALSLAAIIQYSIANDYFAAAVPDIEFLANNYEKGFNDNAEAAEKFRKAHGIGHDIFEIIIKLQKEIQY